MRRAATAAALLLAGLARAALAQQPAVEVEVEPRVGEVGLLMSVTVSVSGPRAGDCTLARAPQVEGARLDYGGQEGTRTSVTVVNGKLTRQMTTRWGFRLVPARPGEIELGAFELDCGGTILRTDPLTIPVRESAVEDVVDLEIVPSEREPWSGETLELEVVAWIDADWSGRLMRDGMKLELPWHEGDDDVLVLRALPTPSESVAEVVLNDEERLAMHGVRKEHDGRSRIRLSRAFEVLATGEGTVTLPASRIEATLARTVEERRDPFDLFGTGVKNVVTSATVAEATFEGPTLTIHRPPRDGRPDSFTNAVGTFTFSGSAAPRDLAVGETCHLSLVLTGEGNLAFVDFPAFEELGRDFRIFAKDERSEFGGRLLELEISPKSERVDAIPRLAFSYFDPERGEYVTQTAGPFELTVRPGGEDGLAVLEAPQEVLEDLETIRETLPAPRSEPWPAWWLVLPGALLVAGVEGLERRRAWVERNPRALERRGARRRLERALAEAGQMRDVSVAFAHFLSARLGGPPAGMTVDEARPHLAHDPDLLALVEATLARWDAAWLGGRGEDVPLERAKDEARELARAIERSTAS